MRHQGSQVLEEGTTVIAHLLDNPAERNCEKSVSQLVEFPRTASCSSRAVLLPLHRGTAVEKGAAPLGIRSSASPRTDHPADTDSLSAGWSVGGGTKGILSAPQTGPWTVEHSAPSSLPDQLRGQSCTEPARALVHSTHTQHVHSCTSAQTRSTYTHAQALGHAARTRVHSTHSTYTCAQALRHAACTLVHPSQHAEG